MTAEQCACRQAEHENLIRELVEALRLARDHVTWPAHLERVRAVLAKARKQGYA